MPVPLCSSLAFFFGRRCRGPVWSPSIIVISPTIQRTLSLSLSLSLNIKMGKKLVKYSVVDAFADSAFKGSPAAVCLLEEDRDDEWLQSVAAEFNLAVTCYLTRIAEPEPEVRDSVPNPRFRLRWFNPLAEVKLCGHGSLAASHFLFNSGLFQSNNIEFLTLSGVLTAKRVPETKQADFLNSENGEAQRYFSIELNFPATPLTEFDSAEIPWISKALNGASMIDMKKTTPDRDLLVVLPSGKTVADLQPQFDEIIRWPGRGVIVTGIAPPGSGFDFFSRFFCPKSGINEDPACGTAHCALANYWSKKLGKCDFVAYQVPYLTSIWMKRVKEYYFGGKPSL
ncbi:uncharacterized protein LOC131315197 isoform X2 [Rhododendron vialii]|uniref:uncharacterized protein LOC131315197 isoform X2 n=1 Tax=Rhododendron vialii TaxID=182163 RepID=UPI00265E8D71|nr:uncharacterized protein LOC131315197 isoform X2 [Rhododendron vialii]